MPPRASAAEMISVWRHWSIEDPKAGQYIDGTSMLEAYCRLLVVNELQDRFPEEHPDSTPSLDDVKTVLKVEDLAKTLGELSVAQRRCLQRISIYTSGRKFCKTREGFIGLVPEDAEPGDSICVILGSDYPMVLRSDGAGHFSVISGECFVHGLMDCGGLLGPLPDGWRVEVRNTTPKPGSRSLKMHFYVNDETGTRKLEDPRLRELPERWTSYYDDDGTLMFKTVDKDIEQDPRLSSMELTKHGVKVEDFVLK